MRGNGDFAGARVLAMAGRKSPWGNGEGTAEAEPPVQGEGAGEGPAADPDAKADGKRPVNPWLPGPESEPQRRSANIEDILRQRAMRGGGGSGGGGATRNWLPLILAGIAAAWIGGTSVHYLGKGEQGLVTTFGRYDRTIGPGPSLTLPWPVQSVQTRNTAKIEETVLPNSDGENLMLTRDRQLADVAIKLRWKIADLGKFTFAAQDTPKLIARLADAEAHAAVAEQRFDDLIDGQRRAEFTQRLAARTQAVLDAMHLGVKVEGAEVIRANQPARLAEAFRKVGEARQEAQKEIEEARADAQKTINGATAQAAAFEAVYIQYQTAPETIRRMRYYEAMERVLSNNNVVIGGSGSAVSVTPPAPPSPASTPSASAGGQ